MTATHALQVPPVTSLVSLTTSASFAHPATIVKEDPSHLQPAHQALSDHLWALALLAHKLILFKLLVVVQALATSAFLDITVLLRRQSFPSCALLVTTVKKEPTNLRAVLLVTIAQLVQTVNYHAHLAITV